MAVPSGCCCCCADGRARFVEPVMAEGPATSLELAFVYFVVKTARRASLSYSPSSKSGHWRQESERKSDTPARATADSLTADSDARGGDSGLLSLVGADVGNERF